MDSTLLYDEFGNYIGPELPEDDEESEEEGGEDDDKPLPVVDGTSATAAGGAAGGAALLERDEERRLVARGLVSMGEEEEEGTTATAAVVPHELKKYYPDHAEVYPEAETIVQEEDTQPITQPIVAPVSAANFDLLEREIPLCTPFSFDFLAALMYQPRSIRCICLLGHLHCGKTTFMDMLVEATHFNPRAGGRRRLAEAAAAEAEVTAAVGTAAGDGVLALPDEGGGNSNSSGASATAAQVRQRQQLQRRGTGFGGPGGEGRKRYTDSRRDEQQRGLSIKATPMAFLLQSSWHKSYLFNILDTPGHVNFIDECTAAMRLCDGAVVVVDALEGVMSNTERLLKAAVEEQLDIILVVNKLDRLILELRLPPADAYHKIRHTLEEVNAILEHVCTVRGRQPIVLSPLSNNVLFAIGQFGLVFSLRTFAKYHMNTQRQAYLRAEHQEALQLRRAAAEAAAAAAAAATAGAGAKRKSGGGKKKSSEDEPANSNSAENNTHENHSGSSSGVNPNAINWQQIAGPRPRLRVDEGAYVDGCVPAAEVFEQALWGDVWLDPSTRKFVEKAPTADAPRTFVQFILEPLYKIITHVVAEEQPTLQPTLEDLGIYLKKDDYKLDSRTLLKKVLSQLFGDVSAFVDMVVETLPDPQTNAPKKTQQLYTGNQEGPVAADMKKLNSDSPVLMIYSTKNYHRPNQFRCFDVLGRVMCGTVYKGQRVKVLGEAFSLDDDEDMTIRDVSHLWIPQGRFRVEVSHVPAGNLILIGGVDASVVKTATITSADHTEEVEIFAPLVFSSTLPVVKIACEPLQPSELPKMLEGLRRIDKSYPIAATRVEESGEHVILGTGEIYLDCVLHDLRRLYGDLEVKVADPVVQFCETVVESSALKCFAETPNRKNKIYMLAEPLDRQIGEDIEKGLVSDQWDTRTLGEHFTSRYGWDLLAARSIWAFGPDSRGANVLLDDTLPSEVDKQLLQQVKESIVQGFQWAAREGPLIEENIRNVKFKILDATIAADPIQRAGGQIIPTARRVAYSAMLLATPRLMEPVFFTEIQCPADCVSAIYTVLSRRRGNVSRDLPKPGTPLYIVHAYLPAIESFGFETDLRTHTCGQAFCLSMFDHWSIVPGDPLDKAILLRPLEPAPAPHLGLSEDVSVHMFFDDPMLLNIATDLQQFL